MACQAKSPSTIFLSFLRPIRSCFSFHIKIWKVSVLYSSSCFPEHFFFIYSQFPSFLDILEQKSISTYYKKPKIVCYRWNASFKTPSYSSTSFGLVNVQIKSTVGTGANHPSTQTLWINWKNLVGLQDVVFSTLNTAF